MGTALSAPAPPASVQVASQQPPLPSPDSFVGLVATSISWPHDGHSVFVTGAWDNWRIKTPLSRRGPLDPFFVVLSLPPGMYQYKYIVDGNWMHNPSVETQTDQHGNLNNILHVAAQRPEYDVNEDAEKAAPQSPPDSYDFTIMPREDALGEPPLLPTLLHMSSADLLSERIPPTSAYVCVDHLFSSKLIYDSRTAAEGCNFFNLHGPPQEYATITHTRRYKTKLITTIMVSLPKRPHFSNTVNELVVGGVMSEYQ